ncbi:MAG: lipopolysaccharide kinase InaA family protein [Planctomycetota bacterium]|jgi:serine/threonine protein kinase
MMIAKNLSLAYNGSAMVTLGTTSDNNIKTAWLTLDNGWSGKAALYRERGKNFSQYDWAECLSRPNLLFEDVENILKIGAQNCVAVKNLQIRDTQLKVVIKRLEMGNGLRHFFRSFRPGKALRNFKTALNLSSSGLPVTMPFAALQNKPGLLTKQSIFITEYFPNSSNLHSFISKKVSSTKQQELYALKKQISNLLASLLASLHKNGLWHRDSKASNFVVCKDTNDKYKILLADMDGIKHYILRRRGRQFRALWKLAASLMSVPGINRTDYWRTFTAYCDLVGIKSARRRPLFRQLARRALAKRMHAMAGGVGNK